ncbi:MAG: sugar phosphorylase [Verrucomicrobia bacterium]|nr:sugar phosphorylase [Verrucomicrobiota bacterium]
MSPRILNHLEVLYGPARAQAVAEPIEALLARHRHGGKPARPRRALAAGPPDVLLIAYADQVQAAGEAPLHTLAGFAARHLRETVSGIHLLPFYPWSSDDGFSVKDYFAVDPAYGSWADVAHLGRSFDLMFDGVFNHLSAQSEWFQGFLAGDPAYREFFVTVEGEPDLSQVVRPRALPLLTEFSGAVGRPRVWTTFSADQVDLEFRNPAVLVRVLEALLWYVAQGARFIRLDAIAYLWKELGTPCIHLPQTHRVIQLLRAALDEVAPHVLLITETNVPHADNVSYFGDGTNEAQLVYNFALPPLVLHSMATGKATALSQWAKSLALPSQGVSFFNFLASHDGIGLNPARGMLSAAEIDALVHRTLEHGGFISYKHNPDGSRSPYEMNINYFDALSNPSGDEPVETQVDRFLVAHAIMLAFQGVPALYFHSLFGSRGDRAGAEASGMPRRINRQKLERARLEEELADAQSLRARVFRRLGSLLRLRRRQTPFHPLATQEVFELDPRVFALRRTLADVGASLLAVHNVSGESLAVAVPQPAPRKSNWYDLVGRQPLRAAGGQLELDLAPYQVVWAGRRP